MKNWSPVVAFSPIYPIDYSFRRKYIQYREKSVYSKKGREIEKEYI